MSHERRRRLLANRQLQGKLLLQTITYWLYCLLSVTLLAACWIIFTRHPASSAELFHQLWSTVGPALLGSLFLLPLVLLDCLRFSHRFAGPMVRIERTIKELADGQQPRPVYFVMTLSWRWMVNHSEV